MLEKLWGLIIAEVGFDIIKAGARLNWGAPKTPELIMADMLKAAELNLICLDEFHKNAVKFGWELWEEQVQ